MGITGYKFKNYAEHAISIGADAKACSYIELEAPDGKAVFGIGISHNINYASIKGILCAINRCQPNVVREPQQPIFEKKAISFCGKGILPEHNSAFYMSALFGKTCRERQERIWK